jgi:hypothetical protein
LNISINDNISGLFSGSDLLNNPVIADNHNRHSAQLGVLCSANNKRVDIKGPCGKHTGNVGQNAGFIFN